MKKSDYLLLFIISLVLLGIGMIFQKVPGYMDAEYYYSNGIRLYKGYGFTEEVIWNYLSDPQGLPVPSHAYWMPLPSILAAGGMFLCGDSNYFCARIPFLLLGAALSSITALISWRFFKNRSQALFSGILAIFSGFYLVYITAVETFGLYLFFGALFLFLTAEILAKDIKDKRKVFYYFLLGLVCSGFYLSRADGVIWLLAAGIVLFLDTFRQKTKLAINKTSLFLFLKNGLILFFGFILFVLPWLLRTYQTFGSITAPGSSYMFFLTEYNQLFNFSPDSLTLVNFLSSGWGHIVGAVINSIKNNLQTLLAVQGSIFLLPFLVVGIWKQRREAVVQVMCFAWIMIFLIMSVAFPHAGFRGGFLHSGSAIQVFFWVMIPLGFSESIKFIGKKRKWNTIQAEKIFRTGMIFLSLVLTVFLFYQKVIIKENGVSAWEKSANHYARVSEQIKEIKPEEKITIMVNDPPGFYLASGQASIMIPNGNLETLFSAAEKFNADILILEKSHVDGLDQLYKNPEMSSRLQLTAQVNDTYIFEILE